MRRANLIRLLVGAGLALVISWIASNTYWGDTTLSMPPKGEALLNPFYAVQRFAQELGARAAWDRVLTVPPPDSVMVLSFWHWSLSRSRREALERWVESGGRLVVDRTLADNDDDFERWSGIVREYRKADPARSSSEPEPEEDCESFREEHDGKQSAASHPAAYRMCNLDEVSFLTSTRHALWALRNASGIQAMRVQAGRGSVTVINTNPFRRQMLFDGDHGWLFVAATQFRQGDDVHFLSEEHYPSLLALVWEQGAPFVTLALALVALVLWRGGVRFGPLAAPPPAARSLAEQIRGAGQFALRHRSDRSLHAACVRALDEAAQRRVKIYSRLPTDQRTAALARLTGFDREALAAAIHPPGVRSSHELRRTIALLEDARRHILIDHTRSTHGTT